ncbi:3-oxoacid CoA-transferase subunit A [Piscinibacter sakaiensis]|uniref:3-oxoacid CoA-transferase, A subunit n=1 Tax=Piscinibacter sakaiensis TaxID=1547922 RepID=A0A0K8P7N1_PISS1|nr:3-oxoacid CoA-transferase subunit A [Piscinibacter sakaiensis]GAP38544.1 3-oxoacid CoA-transferase, A subunit [Piscinibacter sakaiensis]
MADVESAGALPRGGAGKLVTVDAAMAVVRSGCRLMVGEFVGAAEPSRCIEWLLASGITGLTLISNTPGLRGGFGKARLFLAGQVREYIGTHIGTTTESTEEYLAGRTVVRQFLPMGTWAEKVRAGAVGLGGVLVPVGVGLLDEEGLFPQLEEPKPKISLGGREYFVEAALTADVALVKAWRADRLGNLEFRGTSAVNQRDLAMASDFAIAEVNEIVEVGQIEPQRVGCPGVFIDAVVQGEPLALQHDRYRQHWLKLGRLAGSA